MPFVKGKSGNPLGRTPKEHSFTRILEELGDVKDVSMKDGKVTRKQALAEAIWQKAITDRDMAAIRYIYDRIDGQPIASLDARISERRPILIDAACDELPEPDGTDGAPD